MTKISELPFVDTINETGYMVGVQDGSTVRFRADSFLPESQAPTVTPAFISLDDTPTSYTGQAGKLPAVNTGETGLEFIDPPADLPSGGTEGQVLTKNSATDGDVIWADPAGATSAIVNLSAASVDYDLAIGETAYVDFTAQTSVPLHVQTGQGVYELFIDASASSTATSCDVILNPNNTTYANEFTRGDLQISHAFADSGAHTPEGWHYPMPALYVWTLGVASFIKLTISTKTVIKAVLAHVSGITETDHVTYVTSAHWTDRSRAWTSLGTLTWTYAKTGRAVIRRIA